LCRQIRIGFLLVYVFAWSGQASAGWVIDEVVEAESRTVPATEFQPPTGFARKTLREMMRQ